MPFFIRKSQKIGPFRINLSNSGIGLSAGVKGARVSVGPNGTFVHLGRNGMYYKKKISKPKSRLKSSKEISIEKIYSVENYETLIETENFDDVTDIDSQDFIYTLQNQDKKLFLYKWLGFLPLILAALFIFYSNSNYKNSENTTKEYFIISTQGANIRTEPNRRGSIFKVAQNNDEFLIIEQPSRWYKIEVDESVGYIHNSVGTIKKKVVNLAPTDDDIHSNIPIYPLTYFIPIIIGLFIYDRKRKRVDIIYSMDEDFINLYNYQKEYFKEFQSNSKVWQKKTTKRVTNSKYHAGAGNLIKRILVKKAAIDSLPTPLIKTNVEIPHISLSNIDLYFFPERLVLKQNGKFAAVFYKNMKIKESSIRFIEDEKVPRDADIVDHTWKYVNKSGGPDKRFNGNYQIPICNYYQYNIVCNNGINEVIMTSKSKGMHRFCAFINKIGDLQYQFERI